MGSPLGEVRRVVERLSEAVAEAQPPIRMGASLSLTATYTAIGQNLHRGYELCIKHVSDRGPAAHPERSSGRTARR